MNKQIFTFLLVGDRLRGVVCGRCDNPYTLATMENIVIVGNTLYFTIAHEDWGEINPPTFGRVIAARVVQNEMIAAILGNNIEIDPQVRPPGRRDAPSPSSGPLLPRGREATAPRASMSGDQVPAPPPSRRADGHRIQPAEPLTYAFTNPRLCRAARHRRHGVRPDRALHE